MQWGQRSHDRLNLSFVGLFLSFAVNVKEVGPGSFESPGVWQSSIPPQHPQAQASPGQGAGTTSYPAGCMVVVLCLLASAPAWASLDCVKESREIGSASEKDSVSIPDTVFHTSVTLFSFPPSNKNDFDEKKGKASIIKMSQTETKTKCSDTLWGLEALCKVRATFADHVLPMEQWHMQYSWSRGYSIEGRCSRSYYVKDSFTGM